MFYVGTDTLFIIYSVSRNNKSFTYKYDTQNTKWSRAINNVKKYGE